MKIGNVEAAPLTAPRASEAPPRGGSAKADVRVEKRAAARPAEHDAAPPPVHKHVALPDFPNYELSFRLDEERGRVVVQVIDAKTGTVVRTIPPDDLGRALRRLPAGRGVLLDRES